jgi:hypothetical protein
MKKINFINKVRGIYNIKLDFEGFYQITELYKITRTTLDEIIEQYPTLDKI